ncbi:MAG: hypothetical protein ACRERD_20215 [Candidatus Binatia bacterium]
MRLIDESGRSRLFLFVLLLIGGVAAYWFGPGHTYHFYLLCDQRQYTGITVHGFLGEKSYPCVNEFYTVWQPFQNRSTALATAVGCLPGDGQPSPIPAVPAIRDNLQCPTAQAAPSDAWKKDGLQECGEYELCAGKAVICVLAGDDADDGAGMLMHLGVETQEIVFGQWSNQECGSSGKGWHAEVGSCGTHQGVRYKRCTSVFVVPEGDPLGAPVQEQ